ncbi:MULTISPECIES: helix-turn-helix transcriptional regulator [Nitrosomonas]|uniref:helix-turn-helix transcriptional regulator n=1 Tax=Nitrosomonas TaxID=914 RepID=UPI0013708FE4|nr:MULTISPECIES: AlpA family phage regulatory protein [Nitrosomonas]MBL8500470.1 AlpA family phage regulatory protein [Nitrosomonas sp.]MXS83648.1 AlpA family phage regulatory protein [Nitrosomonas oligotropha]UJP01735.1 MAG: AlpA family phage regulatory protein [Nitrosomonas sp.]
MIHDINPAGFSREKVILQLIPLSHSTLWNHVKNGKFPKPVKLSENVTAWRNQDVIAWITEKSGGAE